MKSHISNNPTGTRENAAARRLQVLELRKAGASMRAIARQVGCSVSTAHKHLWAALGELATEQRGKADSLRTLELERLDRYLFALEPAISRGEPRAIAAAVRIMERRARFLGLDAAMLGEQPADLAGLLALLAGNGKANGNGAGGEAPRIYDA